MTSAKDTATFFTEGTSSQFEQVFALYPDALRLKAERKAKKAEELIKLDNWYQNELPKKIKSRGKDAHLVHEELVQCMKWKQTRGKFYPQLSYLVKVNTPRAVMQETKKAFRKLPNLEQAITALSNLKGVGTTMASALLAAACPEKAPFMADECLMAIPEIEGIDYTTKEYLKFTQHIQNTVDRLNKSPTNGNGKVWSPHTVEMTVWTHYIVTEFKPELLSASAGVTTSNNSTGTPAVHHLNGDSLDATSSTTSDDCSNQGGLMLSDIEQPHHFSHLDQDSNHGPLHHHILHAVKNGKAGGGAPGVMGADEDTTNTTTTTTNSYTTEDSLDKQQVEGEEDGSSLSAVTAGAPVATAVATRQGGSDETNDSIADSDSTTTDSMTTMTASSGIKRTISDIVEHDEAARDATMGMKRSRSETDGDSVTAIDNDSLGK